MNNKMILYIIGQILKLEAVFMIVPLILSIVYNELQKHLEKEGISVHDAEIQQFCTCQEMGGFSITIFKLDDELKKYYDTSCYSPYYAKEALK